MLQLLSRLWKQKAPAARSAGPRALRRARLEVETLESRLVMSGVPTLQPVTVHPSVNQPSNSLLRSALNSAGQPDIAPLTNNVWLATPNGKFVDHLYHDLFHTWGNEQVIA